MFEEEARARLANQPRQRRQRQQLPRTEEVGEEVHSVVPLRKRAPGAATAAQGRRLVRNHAQPVRGVDAAGCCAAAGARKHLRPLPVPAALRLYPLRQRLKSSHLLT